MKKLMILVVLFLAPLAYAQLTVDQGDEDQNGQPKRLQAVLRWQPGVPSYYPNPYVFKVYKSVDGKNFALMHTIDQSITHYADGNVHPHTNYWYYVTMYDNTLNQESGASNTIQYLTGP